MILDSSALCANCSCFVCSSTSPLAAMSLLTLSMRFWSVSSLDSVLSRNGALKVMFVGDCPLLGRRISSFRGGFFAALTDGAGSDCCEACWPDLRSTLAFERSVLLVGDRPLHRTVAQRRLGQSQPDRSKEKALLTSHAQRM